MVLGKRIAAWRKLRGLSQVDLAGKLGLTPGAVGMWEIGANDPTQQNLERLTAILRVPLAEFYGSLPKVKRAS